MRCDVINFLQADVFLIDTSRDNGLHLETLGDNEKQMYSVCHTIYVDF